MQPRAPVWGVITILFDTNVEKVTWTALDSVERTISTSGKTSDDFPVQDSYPMDFFVTLKNGYEIKTVSFVPYDEYFGKLTSFSESMFTLTPGAGGLDGTVNIVSQSAGPPTTKVNAIRVNGKPLRYVNGKPLRYLNANGKTYELVTPSGYTLTVEEYTTRDIFSVVAYYSINGGDYIEWMRDTTIQNVENVKFKVNVDQPWTTVSFYVNNIIVFQTSESDQGIFESDIIDLSESSTIKIYVMQI